MLWKFIISLGDFVIQHLCHTREWWSQSLLPSCWPEGVVPWEREARIWTDLGGVNKYKYVHLEWHMSVDLPRRELDLWILKSENFWSVVLLESVGIRSLELSSRQSNPSLNFYLAYFKPFSIFQQCVLLSCVGTGSKMPFDFAILFFQIVLVDLRRGAVVLIIALKGVEL